jgi:hypothetical protein
MSGESPLNMMQAHSGPLPRRGGSGGGTSRAAASRPRRRPWRILGLAGTLIVLAAGWCGLWYYAAGIANRTLTGWLTREAAAGRVYACGSQGVSGFPFRIQVRCVAASAALDTLQPPLAVAAREITFTAQVFEPTVLFGDVTSPLTVAAPGKPPSFVATWSAARMSVSGLPPEPDAVSLRVERPRLDSGTGANAPILFAADDADLQARVVAGSPNNHPVIDAVVHFVSATAPALHAALGDPLQGDVELELRGFKDLSPKPFAERIHEMQAAGGAIEVKALRLERADAIVLGAGTLTVNEHGKLDGVIQLAINGLDNIVPQLGLDKLIGQGIDRLTGATGHPGQGLSALDRLLPGLSGVVTAGANASVVDDLKKMGQPTEIDGKPATTLPLRFADGAIYFGMIRIGEVPALF